MSSEALLTPTGLIDAKEFIEFENGIYFHLFPNRDEIEGAWKKRMPILDAFRQDGTRLINRNRNRLLADNIKVVETDTEWVLSALYATLRPEGDEIGPALGKAPIRLLSCSQTAKYVPQDKIRDTLFRIKNGDSYSFNLTFGLYDGPHDADANSARLRVSASLLYNVPSSAKLGTKRKASHINRYIIEQVDIA